jgi:hypothetical protein
MSGISDLDNLGVQSSCLSSKSHPGIIGRSNDSGLSIFPRVLQEHCLNPRSVCATYGALSGTPYLSYFELWFFGLTSSSLEDFKPCTSDSFGCGNGLILSDQQVEIFRVGFSCFSNLSTSHDFARAFNTHPHSESQCSFKRILLRG